MAFRPRGEKPAPKKPRAKSQSIEIRGMPRRIVEERERSGLGVTELEDKANVGRGTVSRLEAGERIPSAENLFRIARELRVNLHWLITNEGPRHADYSPVTVAERKSGT